MGNNTCCCCIPIRAGVLFIATLSTAFYLALTIWSFIGEQKYVTTTELQLPKIIFWVFVSLFILYAISSLFGMVGAVAKNRAMINIFKGVYWLMAIIGLVVSVGIWIALLVKRDDFSSLCNDIYQHPADYNLPDNLPIQPSQAAELCGTTTRNLLIITGVCTLVGNFIQIYFACVISAYATRLRRTNQHEKLRNLEDFPVEPIGKAQY
ncbi:hypothetical protein BJ944DRAFT_268049 [Cunninghamella echinulata]|nr:hypothetical protein BJ944DRAFT_268049 [Cunninghamella echinulata]